MKTPPTKVLLTGDYWHSDFRTLLTNMDCATTLVPTEKLSKEHLSDASFDLIVLAASRRDQFSHAWVESIRGQASPTPLVALMGTWCEGEQRSGEPWPGVQRIYWHQWQSRFARFTEQLASNQICDWHLPATASHADSAIHFDSTVTTAPSNSRLKIGISAVSHMHYQMIADASEKVAENTLWLETQHWDASVIEALSVVVVDADSWNQHVQDRIQWLRNDLKIDTPIVLLLNFPRQSDFSALNALGISGVVSKPFQLSDLTIAVERATAKDHSFAM